MPFVLSMTSYRHNNAKYRFLVPENGIEQSSRFALKPIWVSYTRKLAAILEMTSLENALHEFGTFVKYD